MKETGSKLERQKLAEDKSQSFLSNYSASSSNQKPPDAEEYQAFSFGRVASRSQPMLTFYKNDDYVEAISYANLNRIWTSDIERELKLDFGDRQVRIEGDNLADLFQYISTNRCSEIKEQPERLAIKIENDTPVVTKIELLKPKLHH